MRFHDRIWNRFGQIDYTLNHYIRYWLQSNRVKSEPFFSRWLTTDFIGRFRWSCVIWLIVLKKSYHFSPNCEESDAKIRKLKSYNINDQLIAWVNNFLCDRKQRIGVNGEFSTSSEVLSGIPQGSILGPLIFLIYINDLPDICTQQDASTKIYLYADDAKNFKVINQTSDQVDLQAVMNSVKNWSDEWLLKLNTDKCKTVSYYLKNSISTQ